MWNHFYLLMCMSFAVRCVYFFCSFPDASLQKFINSEGVCFFYLNRLLKPIWPMDRHGKCVVCTRHRYAYMYQLTLFNWLPLATHTHTHGIPLRKIIIRNGKWWYRGWVPFKLRRCDGGDCGTVCYLLLLMKVCLLMIDLTKLMHLIHTKNDNLSTFPTTLVLLLAKQILVRFR